MKALCQTRFYGIIVRQERFSKTFLVLTVKASCDAPVRYLHENVTLCPFLVYTDVHLRDAANDNNARLSPNYRWNPLQVTWTDNCPEVMYLDLPCTVTFHVQNTGTSIWETGVVS